MRQRDGQRWRPGNEAPPPLPRFDCSPASPAGSPVVAIVGLKEDLPLAGAVKAGRWVQRA